MKTVITKGIVLSRVNYQEADRILTILTPHEGKVSVIAKGVRREKSKLAGGVELLSENEISFIRGRGDVGTLVSSRLERHYPNIIKDIDRTMYAYEFLKLVNKITEDNVEQEYYDLVSQFMGALNDQKTHLQLVKLWTDMQVLGAYGSSPELQLDTDGNALSQEATYDFDHEQTAFSKHPSGVFTSKHIKLLRLARSNEPHMLQRISEASELVEATQRLSEAIRKSQLHV